MVTQPKSSHGRMRCWKSPRKARGSSLGSKAHTLLWHPERSAVAKGAVIGSLLRSTRLMTLVTLCLATVVATGYVPWSCFAWHGGQKCAVLASHWACQAATCIIITYSSLHQHDLALLFSGQHAHSLWGSIFRNASSLLPVFCRPRHLLFFYLHQEISQGLGTAFIFVFDASWFLFA